MTRNTAPASSFDPTVIVAGLEDICEMLTYKRPARSKSEAAFIARFILPTGAEADDYGNYILRIGNAPVLWSSHTDTVHHTAGRQKLSVTADGVLSSDSNCLGADCTTGVWLMLRMIEARRPGLYVFHRAEEIGGLGSRHIAKSMPALLADIRFAIAFDRKGFRSVITHQGGRCCSDKFAHSLADALGMGHELDDGGTFTDTANYTALVPECTNLSIGYLAQHSASETQDLPHLRKLLPALLALNPDDLVEARKVTDADDWQFWDAADQDMLSLVEQNPDIVADFLVDLGVTTADLREHIYVKGGFI